jgi:hypothetical protein
VRRRKFIRNLLLASGGGVAGLALERESAIKPGPPPEKSKGDSRVARPQPGDTPFSKTPIAPDYAARRRMFLEWVAQRGTPPERNGVLIDLVKFEAGTCKAITPAALDDALAFVNARRDPSDFTLADLVRLYFLHKDTEFLNPTQVGAVRDALLNYKYALDEPGKSETMMWTENHQILSHGSDYLAGQLFSNEKFTNDGRTGAEHRDKARELVLRWIDYRARTGPAEWDSIPYYNMDMAALLNLVEFAQDPEVQTRATMMVDLLIFDLAVNSYYGQLGTSHGRAYTNNVLSAAGDSLMTFQALVFGCGRLQSADMASSMLVTGKRYVVPPVLEAIGLDMPQELLNLERHSIPLTADAAAQYGLSLTNLRDVETWWAMGAFTDPAVINLTYDAIEKYDLWNYKEFQPLKTTGRFLRRLDLLPATSRALCPDSNGALLSEVNKITYRTPDAMLSTAQDYRPGEEGAQQHIWQATLGPYAVVFVTNPGSHERSQGPGYWSANGRMPRNAQYRNVLISIYNIERHVVPGRLESRPYGYTHAYFPKWAFDEIVEAPSPSGGGWTFGRVADGYIALYSHLPRQWVTSGSEAELEIGAPGFENVWICQVGRKANDGAFSAFIDSIRSAAVTVEKLQVRYNSPGNGDLQFGWSTPLLLNGTAIPLHGYPRWQNPYTHTEFGAEQFRIACKDKRLELDFHSGLRTMA